MLRVQKSSHDVAPPFNTPYTAALSELQTDKVATPCAVANAIRKPSRISQRRRRCPLVSRARALSSQPRNQWYTRAPRSSGRSRPPGARCWQPRRRQTWPRRCAPLVASGGRPDGARGRLPTSLSPRRHPTSTSSTARAAGGAATARRAPGAAAAASTRSSRRPSEGATTRPGGPEAARGGASGPAGAAATVARATARCAQVARMPRAPQVSGRTACVCCMSRRYALCLCAVERARACDLCRPTLCVGGRAAFCGLSLNVSVLCVKTLRVMIATAQKVVIDVGFYILGHITT